MRISFPMSLLLFLLSAQAVADTVSAPSPAELTPAERVWIASLGAVIEEISLEYWREQNTISDVQIASLLPETKVPVVMGIRKDLPMITGILDDGIAAIGEQERLEVLNRWFGADVPLRSKDAIYNNWFSIRYQHQFDDTLLWQVLAAGLILLAITLYWNRRLSKEISHRKQTEKRLRELGDNIPRGGVYQLIIDKSGKRRFTYLSAIFSRQLGIDTAAAARDGATVYERLDEADLPGLAAAESKAIARMSPFEHEFRVRDLQGTTRWVQCRSHPKLVPEGVRWDGVILDITENKRQREELAESQRKYRQLAEDIGPITILYSHLPSGELTYVSPAMRSVMGIEPKNVIGRRFHDIADWEPASFENWLCELQSIVAKEKSHNDLELSLFHPDGSLRTLHVLSHTVENDQGKISHIEGIATDISERKNAQEGLQLAASVFSHAHEGITIANPEGDIIDVNDAFSHITGYSREEVLGNNPRILKSGRHGPGFYADMWQSLNSKGHWTGEIWNKRKNGEVYPEILTISTVRNDHGETQHYVALFSDITAQKAQQRQLEHIARHDPLTNLPNRRLFADRLHQAMAHAKRNGQRLTLIYLDLDGFKAINDNFGHKAGDELLIAVSKRMHQCMRDGDTIARLGGDEFAAILLDIDSPATSMPIINRILNAASQAVYYGDLCLKVSASAGVTFYPHKEVVEVDQLLRQADQAMYQAKTDGKNRYRIFKEDDTQTGISNN